MSKIGFTTLRPILHHFIALLMVCGMILGTATPAIATTNINDKLDTTFKAAGQEFGVPKDILMSVSYNMSRWQKHNGQSVDGGYGLMNLTTEITAQNARGKEQKQSKTPTKTRTYTLDKAAGLLGVPKETLKKDDTTNIRGAAAVLAAYAKEQNNGALPNSSGEWYGAVAQYNGTDETSATDFAEAVYESVTKGVSDVASDGQQLDIPAQSHVSPNRSQKNKVRFSWQQETTRTPGVDCPRELNCRFVPAAFTQNDPSNKADYGNYDFASRPKDMKINKIVIHDTEGSYASAISHFQDPTSYVSAHYIIRSHDGAVTQMVHNNDVAFHAGNWYENMHSIGVEHEGFATEGNKWYTETMYRASAKLVRYLAQKYDIPMDRAHIVGHESMSRLTTATDPANLRWDPGQFWDWDHYMALVRGEETKNRNTSRVATVQIAPDFKTNLQSPTVCEKDGVCRQLPAQGSNAVYVYSEPREDAPLVKDSTNHPDGTPGTKKLDDTSATAYSGQTFAVADRQNDWVAIWFGGQKGWIRNKDSNILAKNNQTKRIVTPASGKTSIPVYGRPLPEASAYPQGITPVAITPLQDSIPAGQTYTTPGEVANDYYYSVNIDGSAPHDHEVIKGNQKYLQIYYNHRIAYVKASDVHVTFNRHQ